ncbi:MAG: hypothetical protein E7399_09460, partial [Ruminococcaceae bacterium]|nr:hypothetical protein [Oscillospiraceae bacterium]
GSMAHNYYLYESKGKLNVVPWDYNLAFGGMHGNDATAMVNDPIDESYSSTDFFDAFLEQETYKNQYHASYKKLVEYFESGTFENHYQRIRNQIDELVETDPNAMYTYEEYLAGAETLYQTMLLRAESVKGQLNGTIPSTKEGQQSENANLIDASSIDLSVMGVMNMGGPRGERFEKNEGQQPQEFTPPTAEDRQNFSFDEQQAPPFSQNGEANFPDFFQGQEQETSSDFFGLILSGVILVAGFLFVCLYKRKHY